MQNKLKYFNQSKYGCCKGVVEKISLNYCFKRPQLGKECYFHTFLSHMLDCFYQWYKCQVNFKVPVIKIIYCDLILHGMTHQRIENLITLLYLIIEKLLVFQF